ncbi:MAG TPA: 2Fe-2S iron-sulfur cluster binding domain-containing protein [Stellaceae bacterium]|jgi:ferredoxin|nr:2Fe-2S iron-sulfur cluster binding domain-containing protein [Stellaceae bacterium]
MGRSDEDRGAALDAFTVVLAKSGREVRVEEGETILIALLGAGIDVDFSCEEGMCGACETKVLAGVPVHHGSVYPAAEHERRSTALICCAGSRSERLTLDL